MKNFSLDDSFLAILMVVILSLFGSVAYEAKHNGMTDTAVAISAAAHNAVAKSHTAPLNHPACRRRVPPKSGRKALRAGSGTSRWPRRLGRKRVRKHIEHKADAPGGS